MVDFSIALVVVIFSVAATMEIFKNIVTAIGTTIATKRGKTFSAPAYIWWVFGGILSVAGAFIARRALLGSEEPITALLSIMTNVWMLGAWIPLIWWTQMQLDMQVIKKYAVPIIKKLLAKKVGVEDDD